MSAAAGCGGGHCGCAGGATAAVPAAVHAASVNGIALPVSEGASAEDELLAERAWTELLRQEAVRQGRLPHQAVAVAPEPDRAARQTIETMLEEAVQLPVPTAAECLRYYEARRDRYVQGRQVHARHILFAVTPGVDVRALAARAEQALAELKADGARFAALATELSNCPSGAYGGDLGWLAPEECAGELAAALFPPAAQGDGLGLQPRLVTSRFGFHVIEVLERRAGRQLAFEDVQGRIAVELAQQARARALHQYMRVLAGAADVVGVELAGADTPLVQ